MKINKAQLNTLIWISFIIGGLLFFGTIMDAYTGSGKYYFKSFLRNILADLRFYAGIIFIAFGVFLKKGNYKSINRDDNDSD